MKHSIHNRGFALIFSVIVIAIVTIVTLATSSLTRKSLDLSSSGIESQEAFYAADAGIECALYWDIAERDSDGTSSFRLNNPNAAGNDIECFDNNVNADCRRGLPRRICELDIELSEQQSIVTIDLTDGTVVHSRGYDGFLDDSNPTERGLRVEY